MAVSLNNLKNALLESVTKSKSLSTTDVSNITMYNKDHFFLTENNPHSIHFATNSSTFQASSDIKNFVSDFTEKEQIICVLCIGILVIIFFVVVVRTIAQVIRSKNFIFGKYSAMESDIKKSLVSRSSLRYSIMKKEEDYDKNMQLVLENEETTRYPEKVGFSSVSQNIHRR